MFQCWFAHSLRKFAVHDWSIEQKWMSVLLPLLLLYNGESNFIEVLWCSVQDDFMAAQQAEIYVFLVLTNSISFT
jgi:hypothetical protein